MERCIIVGGADIGNYPLIISRLRKNDVFVYCDSGLRHMDALPAEPALIVGDFDSHENPHLDVETIVLPREKDDTDTLYAVKEMVKRGYREFLLIGVIGARLDHTLGNVSILLYLHKLGLHGIILDDYSEMEIVSDTPVQIADSFAYFSLLNISGVANGVTIENAKYPLQDAVMPCEAQIGISNEVMPGQIATVSVKEGSLLLIRIFQ